VPLLGGPARPNAALIVRRAALARRRSLSWQTGALVALAGGAWWLTVRDAEGMPLMPGTMGLSAAAFIGMWVPMMAAMMLPAVAPVASLYAHTIRTRPARLGAFTLGYLVVWAGTALPALGLAWLAGRLSSDHPDAARAAAAGVFALCGLYQFSPLKRRCLRHCRSPLGQLVRYASYGGRLRDLRVGLHHGAFCLGCCWALFLILIAVGAMNVPAMLGLVIVVLLEKLWSHGEVVTRVVGAAALAMAVAVVWVPRLTPGLRGSAGAGMAGMSGATTPEGRMAPGAAMRPAPARVSARHLSQVDADASLQAGVHLLVRERVSPGS